MNNPSQDLLFNPKLDLKIEKIVSDIPPHRIWKAWTQPQHFQHWFCPRPWSVKEGEVDLKPGGKFNVIMLSPEGIENPMQGCVLEFVENKKLVWTDAMAEGFRPRAEYMCTCKILLEPHGNGTKYTAIAIHKDEEARLFHEKMGFYEGWAICLDQLVEFLKKNPQF